ncbi:hypothetical protein chiPu_0029080, partial [Chiloscyllium punctatum]|nr:hypothetical protein [Chiloscyllium punctatum]
MPERRQGQGVSPRAEKGTWSEAGSGDRDREWLREWRLGQGVSPRAETGSGSESQRGTGNESRSGDSDR